MTDRIEEGKIMNIEEGQVRYVRVMGPPTDTEIAVRLEYLGEMITYLLGRIEEYRLQVDNYLVEQERRRRDALDMERIKKEVHDDASNQIPDDDGC